MFSFSFLISPVFINDFGILLILFPLDRTVFHLLPSFLFIGFEISVQAMPIVVHIKNVIEDFDVKSNDLEHVKIYSVLRNVIVT
jgi:hypothetical protein